MVPCTNTALTGHPRFPRSVATLRGAGVRVLLGDGGLGDAHRHGAFNGPVPVQV
ncbi:hypothetical protein WN990_34260 [Kitasatospora purpeofusca]|uniref:hypothetical protein n=1 Tax=Kitasatospora purpeofusca TaxID=67352 RepID=UPI0030F180D2